MKKKSKKFIIAGIAVLMGGYAIGFITVLFAYDCVGKVVGTDGESCVESVTSPFIKLLASMPIVGLVASVILLSSALFYRYHENRATK